jgi:hypothetical protein
MKQITRFIIALGVERIRRLSLYMYVMLVPMHLLSTSFWGVGISRTLLEVVVVWN